MPRIISCRSLLCPPGAGVSDGHGSVHGQVAEGLTRQSSKSSFALSAWPGGAGGQGGGPAPPGASLLREYFPSLSCGSRRDLMFQGSEEEKAASVPLTRLPGSERLVGSGEMNPGSLCPARGSCVCWHSPGRLPGGGVQVGHTRMEKDSEQPLSPSPQGCTNSGCGRIL